MLNHTLSVRFYLFLITAIIAAYFGFWGIDSDSALLWVKQYGYWGIFFTFWWFVVCLFHSINLEKSIHQLRDNLTEPKAYLLLLVLFTSFVVLVVHEDLGFKILTDEVDLLSTSMSMHYDRIVAVPFRGYELDGSFQILSANLGKRPYFFPFLISVVHDFTGYRPENGFYLNQILLLVFLCLCFVIGKRLGGFWAGIVCMLAFSSVPLLSQVANGCGFELLNVLMIVVVIYHSMQYLEKTNERNLATLILAVILLAQVRYESVIFVFPVGVVILLGWWGIKKIIIPNTMLLCPILLLPYPLLNRVFQDKNLWQMKDKLGVEQPFGVEYIYDNIGHAVMFFFSWSTAQPNSFVLAVIGICGLVMYFVKQAPQLNDLIRYPNQDSAVMVCVSGLLALLVLLMAYFWGQFSDPVVRRLSLPIFLLFIIPLVSCFSRHPCKVMIYKILSGVFVLAIIGDSIPTMAKNVITQKYMPGKHVQWQIRFMDAHPSRDFLMIDRPGLWLTHQIPAISHDIALRKKAELKALLDNNQFDNIYVFQRFARNYATSTLVPVAETYLDDDFILEPVAQNIFSSMSAVRIYEVLDIRVDDPIKFEALDYSNLYGEKGKQIQQSLHEQWLKLLP